jgi:small subunit ribosomal protein S17
MPLKERQGIVVSNKMDKTVVVEVENRTLHKKYKKVVLQTKRYKAHNELNSCEVGDFVKIKETRPISRTKCWEVEAILTKSSEIN